MMKRSRHPSSSDDSDNGRWRRRGGRRAERSSRWTQIKPEQNRRQCRDRRQVWTCREIPTGNSTCWSQHSSQHRRGTGQKPSEVFRTDLITAMKVHDSYQFNPEEYYFLADPWRQEWEKGVQVPVSPQSIPQPIVRMLSEKGKEVMFVRPKKLIRTSCSEALGYVDIRTLAEGMCRYDLDEEDVAWLNIINEELTEMALPRLNETTMERVLEELERRCHDNMAVAVETEEGLGIEYDEDVVCDVCQSPDGEDNNEMVFCDKCNVCVHQACYGIQKVPTGSWLCRICALGILPKCQLCPKKGGAMKPTRSGTKWVHVSCALWIPEVSIGNPEKMEPITNVSHIPSNRWALICCLCKEKTGACIQCSAKNCRSAFHVTCCQHAGLEMNTMLTEDEEVKFKAFCPKHSGLEGSEETLDSNRENHGVKQNKRRGREEESVSEAEKRVSMRKLKLQEMEDEFFKFVDVEEVASQLKLGRDMVDFLFQYWKLKRKANFNHPLVTPKKDEEESLARREQEVLLRRLQLFTHLRQDLERVRNLTYMVTRREKMKRSLWRIQEQIFQHQVRLLDHKLLAGDPSARDLEQMFSLGLVSSQSPFSLSSSASSSSFRSKHHKKKKRRKSHDQRDFSNTSSTSSTNRSHRTNDDSRNHQKDVCEAAEDQFKLQNVESQRQNNEKLDQEAVRKSENNRKDEGDVLRRKKDLKRQEKLRKTEQNSCGERQLSIHLVDIRHKDVNNYLINGEWETNANSRLKVNAIPNGLTKKQQQQSNGTQPANGRTWGKFRIPKRKFENEDLNKQRKAMLKPLTNSKRLDGDADLKRCNGNETTLTRRYDFIRRGVLAS